MKYKDAAPPHHLMIESAREYMQIITAAREAIKEWRRFQQKGASDAARAALAVRASFVADTARYAYMLWAKEGYWSGYYQVNGGAVHNCLGCRSIDPIHTPLTALVDLSGLTISQVAARGYRVCAHCRNRTRDKTIARVERMVGKIAAELDRIIEG